MTEPPPRHMSDRVPGPTSGQASTPCHAGDHRDRRILFVVGMHRSGTTLLTDLIGNHPDVSGFHAPGLARMNEGQYLQSVMRAPGGGVLDGVASMGLRRRNHLTERSPLATPRNAARLWSEWSGHWDLDRACLLEKSPGNLVKTRLLRWFFPQARFVLITRHPVAQAMAVSKWAANRPRLQLIANWAAAHATFARDTRDIAVHRVSYEGLCADPETVLAGVLDHAGLAPAALVDRPLRDSNARYIDAWHDVADRAMGAEARLTRALFGRSAARWGYALK
jgi:hypothetical protein